MQITDRHYTDIDIQTSNMHAAGTLQVADITAALALAYLTEKYIIYFFSNLVRYHFQVLFLKEGENCFSTVFRYPSIYLACIATKYLYYPFCYKSLEISSTLLNR